jgi:hypothetical protein
MGTMERRPLPAVHDGRWSTYDVSVLKKMGGKLRTDRTPSKATITNKTRPAGSFSSSYPGRAPCRLGVLCICLFSDDNNGNSCGFEAILRDGSFWSLPGDQFTDPARIHSAPPPIFSLGIFLLQILLRNYS